MCPIPSEDDWRSEPWDLDSPYAYKHFAGRSREEAVRLFEHDALTYQEDVLFMPRLCFNFYVDAYMDYLLSPAAERDSDAASCFFGVIDGRRADVVRAGPNLAGRVATMLEALAAKQTWFDADPEIYGSFEKRAAKSLQKLRRAQSKGT